MLIKIVQSNNHDPQDPVESYEHHSSFLIKGLQKLPIQCVKTKVTFKLLENSQLKVSAIDLSEEPPKNLVVERYHQD